MYAVLSLSLHPDDMIDDDDDDDDIGLSSSMMLSPSCYPHDELTDYGYGYGMINQIPGSLEPAGYESFCYEASS